jgi:hypothetical protein
VVCGPVQLVRRASADANTRPGGARALAGDWAIAAFRPRGRPYHELAQALVALWSADAVERLSHAAQLAGHWSAGEIPLVDAVRETLRQAGGSRLLLVVRLADARLVVTGRDEAANQDTAELVHEALIQHWPPRASASGATGSGCSDGSIWASRYSWRSLWAWLGWRGGSGRWRRIEEQP